MNLRLKLLLTSASFFVVVAAAIYWRTGFDASDDSAGERASSPQTFLPEATASATSAYSLRDVRPGATRAGAQDHAWTDAPAPAQPVTSKAVATSSVPVALTPTPAATAVDAPLRGRRSPREIYTDPTLTRPKPSALSASGTISTDVGQDHPPVASSPAAIPIFAPPIPSADNVVGARSKEPAQSSAAPSHRAELSLEPKPTAEESPRQPTSVNRSPAPSAWNESTDFTAPAQETTPSPRQGRAVLSTEMQRLRAQLGWQAFDQWARARAERGEE